MVRSTEEKIRKGKEIQEISEDRLEDFVRKKMRLPVGSEEEPSGQRETGVGMVSLPCSSANKEVTTSKRVFPGRENWH